MKPLLVGRDAERIEELWRLMHYNGYWRNGPIENNAISGIDMALWDIKGKLAGMPLYQLFGGKCRDGVLVYRHAEGKDIAEICENIEKYREKGIQCVRCQCGGYGGGKFGKAPATAPEGSPDGVYLNAKKYMRDTIKLFEGIRAKSGYEINLCHDVHERLPLIDAIQFARALEPFDLFFLEDAIPLEQLEWLRALRAASSIPLSLGELFNNPYEWKTIIADRLIDFIRVHISQIGGISPARKLQVFAENYGVRIAWHGPGDMSPVSHAANIHIDIASGNFGIQEWSGTEPPNFIIQDLRENDNALLDVFSGLPEFRNGYVYPNDKPGLGVDLDEKAAARYPCKNEVTLWTQTRATDGSLLTP
jgi:mannonate dehydratase